MLKSGSLNTLRHIIKNANSTLAWYALMGDKELIINKKNTAFLMYALQGRSAIALGDPFGLDKSARLKLINTFTKHCHARKQTPIFYRISSDFLQHYRKNGFKIIKIGEEALVPLENFSVATLKSETLRRRYRYFKKRGYTFKILNLQESTQWGHQINQLSEKWLRTKSTRWASKKFSVGFYSEEYIKQVHIAALFNDNNELIAYSDLLINESTKEIGANLWRYDINNPHKGAMDYLFIEMMLWGEAMEYQHFNLSTAPLSGPSHKLDPISWNLISKLCYRYSKTYNFRGIRRYKAKFSPVWQEKYMAFKPGFLKLPRAILNITKTISG